MAKQVTTIAATRAHVALKLKKNATATADNTIPVSMLTHPQAVV